MIALARRYAAVLIIGLLLSAAYLLWVHLHSLISSSDIIPAYVAGREIAAGTPASMYDMGVQARQQPALVPQSQIGALPYLNPPAFALLVTPLTIFDAETAANLWAALQVIIFMAALALIARDLKKAPWKRRGFAFIWTVCAIPITLDVVYGQTSAIAALLLAGSFHFWQKEKPYWAAALIGISAALLKPQLMIGLICFAAARNGWRALGAMVAGGAAIALIPAIFFGPQIYAAFFDTLRSYESARPAIYGTGILAFFSGIFPSTLAGSLTVLADAIALACTGWLGRRSRTQLSAPLLAALCISLLVPPHVMPYDVSLLAPVLLALQSPQNAWATVWRVIWVVISAAALLDYMGIMGDAPLVHVIPLVLTAAAIAATVHCRTTESTAQARGQMFLSRPLIANL